MLNTMNTVQENEAVARKTGYHMQLKPMQSYDVYDSPPIWLRITMGFACVAGALIMLISLSLAGQFLPVIIIAGGLVLALYLITIVPTGANLALVVMGYWALLGGIALFGPV